MTPIVRGASRGVRETLRYEYKLHARVWLDDEQRKLIEFDNADKLHWNSKGKPWRVTFEDEYKGQPFYL